ncbi:hypothetical protein K469DRAFT_716944 [Zopfia rhizophila CBS 207.26]|uniref:Uncharacterized protein n=1 Tax=Zopfia rhizophila CBS 207.26 TaxID=1314779 RepID=A0A6A6ER70_9PEZI|nr:hypothetical protein K469DRAFT_716944 [Zopfia rhizophila CBS 207.26]
MENLGDVRGRRLYGTGNGDGCQTRAGYGRCRNFDQASRGPFGSLVLLWRGNTSSALLDILITILALAFDPMAQQLADYPLKTTREPSENVTAARTIQYSMVTTQRSVRDYLKNGELDHTMKSMIDIGLSFTTKHLNFARNISRPKGRNCN